MESVLIKKEEFNNSFEFILNNDLILENILNHLNLQQQIALKNVCTQFNSVILNRIWKKSNKYLTLKCNKLKQYSVTINNLKTTMKKECIYFENTAECMDFLQSNHDNVEHMEWDREMVWSFEITKASDEINPLNLYMKNVQKITLNFVKLNADLIEAAKRNCPQLKELNILDNQNSESIKNSELCISDVSKLENLTLRFSYSLHLNEFCKLAKKLKYLNIQHGCQINALTEVAVKDSKIKCEEATLENLEIRGNHVEIIFHNSLFKFPNLKRLYISNFFNINSSMLRNIAESCPNLQVLQFIYSSFNLPTSVPLEITNLTHLREVHMTASEELSNEVVLKLLANTSLEKLNLFNTMLDEERAINNSALNLCSHNYSHSTLKSLSICFEDDENADRLVLGVQQFWLRLLEVPHLNIFQNLQELFVSHCWRHFDKFLNNFSSKVNNLKKLHLHFVGLENVNISQLQSLEELVIYQCSQFSFEKLLQQISLLKHNKILTLENNRFYGENASDLMDVSALFLQNTESISLEILNIKEMSLTSNHFNELHTFLQLKFSNKLKLKLYNSCFQSPEFDYNLLKQFLINNKNNKNLKSLYIEDFIIIDINTLFDFIFDPLIRYEIFEFAFADYKFDLSCNPNEIKDYINSLAKNWCKMHFSILFIF